MSNKAPTVNTITTVSAFSLKKHAYNCIESQTPFMVWGNPGIGKSEILRAICEKLGYHFEDIRLSQIDSIDLRGLPFKELGFNPEEVLAGESAKAKPSSSVEWAVPDFLQRAREAARDIPEVKAREAIGSSPAVEYKPAVKGRPTAFFFDEINAGSPATMAAAYQFINDRRVGPHELNPLDIVFAAGNLDTDGGITNTMPTPLCNRFRHYILRVDVDSFLEFASAMNYHPWVTGYLAQPAAGKNLQNFDPDFIMGSDEKSFATPRTWSMVSKALKAANFTSTFEEKVKDNSNPFASLDEDLSMGMHDLSVIVASCVGSGIATEFAAYVKEGMDLPKAKEILAGKISNERDINIKDSPSKQYFVANDCCYSLKEYKDKIDALKEQKQDYQELNKQYMKAMENFVLFSKKHCAPEMFIYGVVSTMIKRFRLIPEPAVMDKKVFDLIIAEFEKAKTSK